jgi:serine/threonine protein kinase
LGYFTTNSSFYLIFEPGNCDLFARIEADGPLSENDAKPIFRDLLLAVSQLHQKNIAHRDIKLENLIVLESGEVKLTDFGLAEVINGGKKLSARKGTFKYWAPEIILGKRHDLKVDIWAIGVCLFACLTGTFPFMGESEYDYTTGVIWDQPDLERMRGSKDVLDIVKWMLKRQADERPTVGELLKSEWIGGIKSDF